MTDIPATMRVEYAGPSPRCHRTIVLHGRVYRCARRAGHNGIHDANASHPGDGQAVRW